MLNRKIKKSHLSFLLGIIIVTVFWAFKDGDDFKIAKSLDIFYSLFRDVNTYYVDDIDPEKMVEDGISSMLKKLDPYTVYIPERDMDDFTLMTTGKYGGIGALIRNSGEYPIIAEPYKDFPAYKGGLKAGDKILEIDGKSTKDFEISKVSEHLKGIPKTKLKLLIERPYTNQTFEKEIVREEIKINSVPYYGLVSEGVGYIRVNKFTPNVASQVKDALRSLKADYQITSLILDLRGNLGGLLVEAPKMCNIFIEKGEEIVSTKGKLDKWNQTLKTSASAYDTEIPIVVLVSRATASASEIVAGALQDLDRAVILGSRTFGKGLVQTTLPLNYNSQVKITTAKYYIPSGRCVQALDYTNRNEDGSVGHVPDSLISEFKTRNGRKVYDGGGITPDVTMKNDKVSNIAISLITQSVIFDYATKFAYENETIADIDKFDINDEIYDNFVEFALEDTFKYESRSAHELKEFEKVLKQEKYYDLAQEEFEKLKVKLKSNKKTDLHNFKSEIKQFLLDEIAGRYYYQTGKIKAQLKDDKQLFRAIEILNNQDEYKSILSAK